MKTPAALSLALLAALCVSCQSEPGVARSQEEIDQILQKGATGMGKPNGTAAGAPPPVPGAAPIGAPRGG